MYALPGPNPGPPPALTPLDAGVAWMRQVSSAPVVLSEVGNGVVYAWSHDRHAYSFRADTGKELSRFPIGEAGSHYSVEVITDGVAYLALPRESARAVDMADGTTLWTYVNEEGRRNYTVGIFAESGTTYIGLREELLALRSDTGEELWRLPTPGIRGPDVLVHAGVAYPHGSGEYRQLYAVDADTGELLWEHQPVGFPSSPPVVVDETLYVNLYDGKVIALDAATGALRWTYDPVLVLERAGDEFSWNLAPLLEPPLVAHGMVYLGFVRGDFGEPTDQRYSEIHALDAETGNLVWRLPLDGAYHSLAQQDGVVFVTAQDGLKSVWGTEPRSALDVQPLSGYLHALDASTGNLIWSARTRGNPVSPSVVQDDLLYAHSFDQYSQQNVYGGIFGVEGQITAFSVATGEPFWFYRAEFLESVLPWPEAGIIFAALDGGWVYALTNP